MSQHCLFGVPMECGSGLGQALSMSLTLIFDSTGGHPAMQDKCEGQQTESVNYHPGLFPRAYFLTPVQSDSELESILNQYFDPRPDYSALETTEYYR